MANPQRENGHVEIATEIWEQLTKIRIPGQARQVLDFILRKTYGWHKKIDIISLSQFVQGTGLHKNTVCKAINKLLDMNLITKKGNAKSLFTQKGNDTAITYGFQKDYEKWNPLPKRGTYPIRGMHVPHKGNQTFPIRGTTKDTITKDTITKDTTLGRNFDLFWKAYPKKMAKGTALKAWKAIKLKPDINKIVEAIGKAKKCDQWQKENGKYIPHPATWLRAMGWEDEIYNDPLDGVVTDITKKSLKNMQEWMEETGYD